MKDGFFPAPDEAIEGILKHLIPSVRPPDSKKRINILDPCAGEGKALINLWGNLGGDAYAIELNGLRAERIAQEHMHVKLLGPCSIMGCRVSFQSMSLLYLNPPFDSEIGGGKREELAFLERATNWLVRGGVLVFVLPVDQVFSRPRMVEYLDVHYEDLEVFKFPDSCRKYKEIVVFGRRRKEDVLKDQWRLRSQQSTFQGRGFDRAYGMGPDHCVWIPELGRESHSVWNNGKPDTQSDSSFRSWTIPLVDQARNFEKITLTDEEIGQMLAKSPCYKALEVREEIEIARPPLPLGKGHTGMSIMCGILDGFVDSDPPHVVRGDCGKVNKHVRSSTDVTEAGTTIEKEVYVDVPNPTVRAVWADGTIKTFEQKASDPVSIDAIVDVDGDELPESE